MQSGDDLRPAGRLVAPDEGAHADTEPDEVARKVGPDAAATPPRRPRCVWNRSEPCPRRPAEEKDT
ncbi:DUF5709 domain-containing protein [Nonomuraea indica]|uniref:DUF5709 domain-containing protein n=1 Tax=Nonomuraea indica TaxID=1581193 RepID=A0ABW8ADP7_9ACTN